MTSTAPAYDSATDPNRVSEARVRDLLKPGTMLSGGIEVVEQGRFKPGGKGCYASVMVIGKRTGAPYADRPYSTHEAYVPSEADGLRPASSQSGHYDLTLAEAVADLDQR